MMSKFATFCTVVAAFLLLISSTSAYRSLSLERNIGENYLLFNKRAIENTTIYYGVVSRDEDQTEKELIVRRVQASFSGGSPKEDECKITLRAESGNVIQMSGNKIDPLGKDRVIVHWIERTGQRADANFHLRFSIVDFSNCKVRTTKLSGDLSRALKQNIIWNNPGGFFYEIQNAARFFKGENDVEILSFDEMSVYKFSINAEGVVSKDGPWLTYPIYFGKPTVIFPLSKDNGYLLIEASISQWPKKPSMTVAHIQPDGQRKNLTYIEDVYEPTISLVNGLIGICFEDKNTTMICTQFKLGDKEIQWFLANIAVEKFFFKRAIYNLPRGEGFLTHVVTHAEEEYLVKIGLDGKTKQLVNSDMTCERSQEEGFYKIFEDDRGNYCLNIVCAKVAFGPPPFIKEPLENPSYIKLQSKCFEPEDFKNVSK